MDWHFLLATAIRAILAVVIGALIGSERERHGRAAGMRTHVLVCLGAALTSVMSLYVNNIMEAQGDVLRIPAQVISGIGFLGAGMIILKNDNVVIGLTTAAGVWTTGIIGIAVGYGFYSGAVIATALFLITTSLLTKFEHRKRTKTVVYVEIDDMYKANLIIRKLKEILDSDLSYTISAPRSEYPGNLGISIVVDRKNQTILKGYVSLITLCL